MKTKIAFCSSLVAIFFAMTLVFSFVTLAADTLKPVKKLTLRWSDVGPSTGLRPDYMRKAAAEVAKATDGRVQIDFYWTNSLVSVKENVRAVQKGVADMAWTAPPYHPAEYPISLASRNVLHSPFGDDAEFIVKAFWEMWDEYKPFRDEVEKWGSTVWLIFPYDSYGCYATKPIRKLEDLKGIRLRISGEYVGKMVSAVGGFPEFLASSEVYSALEKGIVDGAICGYSWGKGYRIYEVADYLNLLDVTIGVGYGIVSIDALNKMSEQDREAFMEIGRRVSLELGKATKNQRVKLIQAMDKAGVTVVPFPEEERARWAELPAVKALIPNWIEAEEKAGRGEAAKGMMKIFLEKFGLSHLIPK